MTDDQEPKLTLARAAVLAGMTDIRAPKLVQVAITSDGRLWVNVDDICLLRAQEVGKVELVVNGKSLDLVAILGQLDGLEERVDELERQAAATEAPPREEMP